MRSASQQGAGKGRKEGHGRNERRKGGKEGEKKGEVERKEGKRVHKQVLRGVPQRLALALYTAAWHIERKFEFTNSGFNPEICNIHDIFSFTNFKSHSSFFKINFAHLYGVFPFPPAWFSRMAPAGRIDLKETSIVLLCDPVQVLQDGRSGYALPPNGRLYGSCGPMGMNQQEATSLRPKWSRPTIGDKIWQIVSS